MAQPTKRALLALKQARAAHGFARQQETIFHGLVLAALSQVARSFTDLIAAAKPVDPAEVAHIKTLWAAQVPALAETAAAIYERAGNSLARAANGSITQQLRTAHLLATQNRLMDVGDALWESATTSLAEGALAGEGYEDLTRRLVDLFAEDGKELGESTANRIARTTVQSAVNGGSTDAMRNSENPPTYRAWVCTADTRTRDTHFEADGQIVALDAPFMVGGEELDYPGDPNGSDENVINCRCVPVTLEAPTEIPLAGRGFRSDEEIADVEEYFADRGVERTPGLLTAAAEAHTQGMIALIPSDEDAARLAMDDGEPVDELHVTLMFLGKVADMDEQAIEKLRAGVADQAEALGPVDAEAFAVSWFNPAGDEPCWVLGISGDGLAQAHSGSALTVSGAETKSEWACHEQHPVWVPHLTVRYSDDPLLVEALAERVGPIRFDRIRLALAGDNYDVPLTGGTVSDDQEAQTMTDVADAVAAGIESGSAAVVVAAEAVAAAAITEPDVEFTTARIRGVTLLDIGAFTESVITTTGPVDDAGFQPWAGVVAVEGIPTGDGRIYLPDSFRWEDDALGKLRWDIEDDGAHMGAVTVGQVHKLERQDGGRIWGEGVFDTNLAVGAVAAGATERGTLGGVSVDMDDIPMDSVVVEGDDMEEPSDEPSDEPVADDELAAALTLRAPLLFPAGTNLNDVVNATSALLAAAGNTLDTLAGPAFDMTAAASGQADLPIAPEDTAWEADAAHDTLVTAATTDEGVDTVMVAKGHLWLPGTADGTDMDDPASYRLPFAQVIDGELTAVPAGIDWAAAEAVRLHTEGDMSDEDATAISEVLTDYYERMSADEDVELVDEEIMASAWAEFREMPALPAAAFGEPDLADVNEYLHLETVTAANGRQYQRMSGWVAQNGVCHDAFNGCITVPVTADLATFNRQPVTLDDGSVIQAGAFTMNAGHDNDGANAASMRAQFDDTRTVAGIVTVGHKADGSGTWFSGIAAPWLSEWDQQVVAACRPSGHWKRTNSGGYSLRAVLSVPVPGFPNRVAASAVVERSNFALVASAAIAAPDEPVASTDWGQPGIAVPPDGIALLAAAIVDEMECRAATRAEVDALSASLNDERKLVAAALTADEPI